MKEAPYKLVRPFCNAKGQSKAGQEHRKALTDRVQRHQAGQKASKKEGYRKQNQAKKDASCKEGPVFFRNHSHADGNGKGHGTAQGCCHENACIGDHFRIGCQFYCQLKATHINSDDTAQHGGVQAKELPERHDCFFKAQGQKRHQTDDSCHGKSRGP